MKKDQLEELNIQKVQKLKNNEERFSGKGEIYARTRPIYAKAFIDYLFSDVGINESSVVADIGSGTGILTQQLLNMGCKEVFAVEPNDDMRKQAEINLNKHAPKFQSITATAEATGLSSQSVDFVTVAQAFHWFYRESFKKECRRILKENGKVVLAWNTPDENTILVCKYDLLLRQFCPDYVENASRLKMKDYERNLSDFFSGKFEIKAFHNDITFDKQSFIDRTCSSSYALKEGDEGYEAYITALIELFDEYSRNGILVLPNKTRSYVGIV